MPLARRLQAKSKTGPATPTQRTTSRSESGCHFIRLVYISCTGWERLTAVIQRGARMEFSGKRALVTGGSRGIGAEICRRHQYPGEQRRDPARQDDKKDVPRRVALGDRCELDRRVQCEKPGRRRDDRAPLGTDCEHLLGNTRRSAFSTQQRQIADRGCFRKHTPVPAYSRRNGKSNRKLKLIPPVFCPFSFFLVTLSLWYFLTFFPEGL